MKEVARYNHVRRHAKETAMRKLFVVVLALASILLLQAPASAQRLYRLDAVEGPGSPAKFIGVSDCRAGDTITVRSKGFSGGPSRSTVRAKGIFRLSATITDVGIDDGYIEIVSARCAQQNRDMGPDDFSFGPRVSIVVPKGFELPFTGVSVMQRLALGLSLLLAGVLLVRLSPHPSRRGSPTRRRERFMLPGSR
jgi:hypothetical protein